MLQIKNDTHSTCHGVLKFFNNFKKKSHDSEQFAICSSKKCATNKSFCNIGCNLSLPIPLPIWIEVDSFNFSFFKSTQTLQKGVLILDYVWGKDYCFKRFLTLIIGSLFLFTSAVVKNCQLLMVTIF